MNFIEEKLDQVVNFITRPHRNTYTIQDLGPKCFRRANRYFVRDDFEIPSYKISKNQASYRQSKQAAQKLNILCSLFRDKRSPSNRCLLFMHGNTGNRVMGCEILETALDNGLSYACFDFLGCGSSGGDYITLGFEQKDQIMLVMQYLSKKQNMKNFILAGRSMGAAAITMLLKKNYENPNNYIKLGYKINGLILDSPYCDLRKLLRQTAQEKLQFIPSMLCQWAIQKIDQKISQKFYPSQSTSLLEQVSIKKQIQLPFPIAILYGNKDQIISLNQVIILFKLLKCDKKLHILQNQGHQGKRSHQDYLMILEWLATKNKRQDQSPFKNR